MLAYRPAEVTCACGYKLHAIIVKRRPRFFVRDEKGRERNITHCPACEKKLVLRQEALPSTP